MATNYDTTIAETLDVLIICKGVFVKLNHGQKLDDLVTQIESAMGGLRRMQKEMQKLPPPPMVTKSQIAAMEALKHFHPGNNERYGKQIDPQNPGNDCGCDECVRKRANEQPKT